MDEKLKAEKWKVWSVMQIMRQLPQERSEAREILKLATELVELHGHETPVALKQQWERERQREQKRQQKPAAVRGKKQGAKIESPAPRRAFSLGSLPLQIHRRIALMRIAQFDIVGVGSGRSSRRFRCACPSFRS